MLQIFYKTVILLAFCAFLIHPVIVFASTEAEEQRIDLLEQQIKALIVEIARLQSLLSSILQSQTEVVEPLSESDLNSIINDGVEWFKNAQEKNGHFKYEYLPYEDRYLNADNIVRQTGALYVLGEVALRDSENIYGLENTGKQAATYFESLSVSGEHNGKTFRCIVNNTGSNTCKLGATSLALVGILDFMKRYPAHEETYTSLVNDYINFVLAMKMEGKGFRSHFYIEKDVQTEDESPYANGEALLALVRFYEFNPTLEVKEVIDDTFTYIESDKVPFDIPLYLWAMAAVKNMYDMWPDEKYVKYVKSYTDWRIDGFRRRRNTSHNTCGYLEGVVSAYAVLKPNISQQEQDYYMEEIDFWLNKNSKLQITKNNTYRIIYKEGRGSFVALENAEQAIGGFLTGQNELKQRIDFTQHCISSYLQKLVDIEAKILY